MRAEALHSFRINSETGTKTTGYKASRTIK
jgi:hypothetical protein